MQAGRHIAARGGGALAARVEAILAGVVAVVGAHGGEVPVSVAIFR